MSWLQVGCPRCPAVMNVPVTLSGQTIVCAACGLSYQVPGTAATGPTPPQATSPPSYPPLIPPPAYGAGMPPAGYGAPLAQATPPGYATPARYDAPLLPTPVAANLAGESEPARTPTVASAVVPASPLRPLEVLAPPSPTPLKSEPRRSDSSTQAESSKVPVAADSPTLMLPPPAKPRTPSGLSPLPPLTPPVPLSAPPVPAKTPASSDESARAGEYPSVPPAPASSSNPPRDDNRKYPGEQKAAETGLPAAEEREELTALEMRMRRERRRALRNLAMFVFGVLTMMLFAYFVIHLSRPT